MLNPLDSLDLRELDETTFIQTLADANYSGTASFSFSSLLCHTRSDCVLGIFRCPLCSIT